MHTDNWVKIHTFESIFEMDIIRDALEKDDIEYNIKEYKDTAYDGLFVLQKGYGALFVKEKDKDAAMAIVNRLKSIPYVAYSKD